MCGGWRELVACEFYRRSRCIISSQFVNLLLRRDVNGGRKRLECNRFISVDLTEWSEDASFREQLPVFYSHIPRRPALCSLSSSGRRRISDSSHSLGQRTNMRHHSCRLPPHMKLQLQLHLQSYTLQQKIVLRGVMQSEKVSLQLRSELPTTDVWWAEVMWKSFQTTGAVLCSFICALMNSVKVAWNWISLDFDTRSL